MNCYILPESEFSECVVFLDKMYHKQLLLMLLFGLGAKIHDEWVLLTVSSAIILMEI